MMWHRSQGICQEYFTVDRRVAGANLASPWVCLDSTGKQDEGREDVILAVDTVRSQRRTNQ
ncbi:hypothetical protein BofuT4_uP100440.1 [Botrytis cinerea T4]|uniref:Uncharacterized protein n=1 Tax=Botryotinia fuckeliana (strain T4) TaxID=999810 RepID=G2YBP9_BOTF4|nr:hypothetical protein BofuT4_uP100440.1 [Botrytis cinerea T4]